MVWFGHGVGVLVASQPIAKDSIILILCGSDFHAGFSLNLIDFNSVVERGKYMAEFGPDHVAHLHDAVKRR